MNPMSTILTTLAGAPATRASAFAHQLQDNSFNGTASAVEMGQFCDAALAACAQKPAQQALVAPALAKIKHYAAQAMGIRFRNVDRNVVLYQLVIRVMSPQRINQIRYGLCGPAHFAVLLAKTKPADFVDLAIGFLRDGRAQLGGTLIEVEPTILDYQIPVGFIAEADWVVAASLRNSTDKFPYSEVMSIPGHGNLIKPAGTEGKYVGTDSTLVCAWLKDAGYSQIVGLTNPWKSENFAERMVGAFAAQANNAYFHPSRPTELAALSEADLFNPMINLRLAERLLNRGWSVLMSVNEDWSGTDAVTPAQVQQLEQHLSAPPERAFMGTVRVPKAKHWIYVKRIDIAGDTLRMTIYTYGAKKTLPYVSVDVFLQNYGGFVAATG